MLEFIKLSKSEAVELAKCIESLQDLEHGRRPPRTKEEKRFISVCRGELEPQSICERAYLKWRIEKPDLQEIMKDYADRAKHRKARQSKINKNARKIIQNQNAREERRKGERLVLEAKLQFQVSHENARTLMDRKFTPRNIDEPLGTREDFKKDTKNFRKNGR